VVVWAWELGFAWNEIRREMALFAAVVTSAMIIGGVRQITAPPAPETVRVATVVPSTGQLQASLPDDALAQRLLSGEPLVEADAAALRAGMAPMYDELFRHSTREARAGAELILWPEGAAWVLAQDEAALLSRGRALAQAEGVYLAMGLATFHDDGSLHENKLVLLDPAGEAVLTYHKTMLVPFAEDGVFVAGAGEIPVVDTPFGRVGAVICHDMDHHEFMAQLAGRDVDLLLVPVGDWADIGRTHLNMSRLRAVEQGVTVVRAARGGISAVIGPQGEVLASLNRGDVNVDGTLLEPPLPATTGVLVAEAPAQSGVATLYSVLGDAFAWANLLAFAALAVLAFARRRAGAGDPLASKPSPA
jgi:apolipoprotein N-acyltransferase